MKYNNTNFMQVSRCICNEEYTRKLSVGARLLFVTLNDLEQTFCNEQIDYIDEFYRTDAKLAEDMNVSINTLRKYKAELKKLAPDLVEIRRGKRPKGKATKEDYTIYRILK